MAKKSFQLYQDSLSVLDELTDEQAGKLFRAIRDYQVGIEHEMDFGLKMAFLPFKNQFIRQMANYQEKSKVNAENGKMGGRPKKANESEITQTVIDKPKKSERKRNNHDTDTDKDTDTDTDTVTDKDTEKEKKRNNTSSSSAKAKVSEPKITSKFLAVYNDFLQKRTGTGEKFSIAGRKGLKDIIAYLTGQVKSKYPDQPPEYIEEQTVVSWEWILTNYEYWEPFHQNQLKLEQINSNLLNIISSARKKKINGKQISPEQVAAESFAHLENLRNR